VQSARRPASAWPIPRPGAGGLLLPAPEIPGAAPGARVGTSVARGTGEGVTSFARPLGGYQTTPHYPESARREGAEGVVTLRFEVLTSGKVGTIQVQRSAGRPERDGRLAHAIEDSRFARERVRPRCRRDRAGDRGTAAETRARFLRALRPAQSNSR